MVNLARIDNKTILICLEIRHSESECG